MKKLTALWKTMTRKSFIFLVLLGLGLQTKAQNTEPLYEEGSVYIKIKNSANMVMPDYTGSERSPSAYIADLIPKYNVTKLSRPFASTSSAILNNTYKMEFKNASNIDQLINELRAKPSTEYVERVPINRIFAVPNDPLYAANQWSLQKIQATQVGGAFDDYIAHAGNTVVNIAIVDNEIRTTHTDLAPIMLAGQDVADNDANTNPPNATFDHGTHCAGIAAARTNNANGVASLNYPVGAVAPGNLGFLRIIPVKVTSDANPNPGNISHGYQGITWASLNGARVISCSWGSSVYSQTEQNVIDDAYNRGCIIVAAAGNDSRNVINYPASYNHVISVGATNDQDQIAPFSTYNNAVDVMAPGQDIYSTVSLSDNAYGLHSGTSMACPLTAGLVGMMWSINTNLSQNQLETCLRNTCTNISTINPNYSGLIGSGRINADQALACVNTGQTIFADFTSNITQVCPGQAVNFTDLTGGIATGWLWDFGDGTPNSNVRNPVHVYNGALGTQYTVTLTSTGPGGNNTIIKNVYITVALPTAQIVGQGATTVCDNSPQLINLQFTGNPPFSVTFSNGTVINGLLNRITSVIVYVSQGNSPLTITSTHDVGCAGNVLAGQANFIFVQCCPSVIVNGDFAAGNTLAPAETDLHFNPNSYASNNYAIYNPSIGGLNNSWPQRIGLPNRGLSFAYDGYNAAPTALPKPHTRVWCQTVPRLESNMDYEIQFFTTDNVAAANGKLEFQVKVNNTFINAPIDVPPGGNQGANWNQNNTTYTSTALLLNAEVCICQVGNHNTSAYDIILDDISMRPKVNAGPDVNICLGQSTVLGAIAASPAFNYQWTPATGLNNPNIAQPTATPAVTTVYTVVATNTTTGCIIRDEVTVTINTNCCLGAWNAPVSINANTVVASPAFANAAVSQSLIITSGNTLTFDNIDVLMGPNVRITVNNGAHLVITNSARLHACSTMWDGIYIQFGGDLTINTNGLVEDANNAIVSNNGALYTLDGAILNKNRIGILVTTLAGQHPGTIRNSIITCRNLTYAPKPQVATLKGIGVLTGLGAGHLVVGAPTDPNNYENRSDKGIWVVSVGSATLDFGGSPPAVGSTGGIDIGNPATAANQNVFDNLNFGIFAENSNIKVKNNRFQNITPYKGSVCGFGCFNPSYGVAILGQNTTASANGTQIVSNSNVALIGVENITPLNLNESNNFTECGTSITLNNYGRHTILYNVFQNAPSAGQGLLGITINSSFDAASTVNNNTFNNYMGTGVQYLNNWNTVAGNNLMFGGPVTIANNNFSTPNSSDFVGTAITLSQPTTMPPVYWVIRNGNFDVGFNTIGKSKTGISMTGITVGNAKYIRSNTITVQGIINTKGIYLNKCDGISVDGNTLTGDGQAYANKTAWRGIYVLTSPNSYIHCNSIIRVGQCIVMEGNSSPSAVRTNYMDLASDGLVFLNNCVLGPQGSTSGGADNQWGAPANFYRSQTYVQNSPNINTNSPMYVANSSSYNPTKNLNSGCTGCVSLIPNVLPSSVSIEACPINTPITPIVKNTTDPIASSATLLADEMKLYPNPNNGTMNLDYTLSENERGALRIYDITGKLITSYELNSSNNQLAINNEELINGMYIYHVVVNDRIVKSDKLVIIK